MTEHDIADAGLDLLLRTAAEFNGDESGNLTDEEQELLMRIGDTVEDEANEQEPEDDEEDADDDDVEPIQNAEPRFYRPENYDKISDLPSGRQLWAGANDWECGWTWAWITDKNGTKNPPLDFVEVDHSKCPGCGGDPGSESPPDEKACREFAKKQVYWWAKQRKKVDNAATDSKESGTGYNPTEAPGSEGEEVPRQTASREDSDEPVGDDQGDERPGDEPSAPRPGTPLPSSDQPSQNAFCSTGEGGGVDPSCSPTEEAEDMDWLKEEGTIGDLEHNIKLYAKDDAGSASPGVNVNALRQAIAGKVKEAIEGIKSLHASGKVHTQHNSKLLDSPVRVYVQQRNKGDNGYVEIKANGSRDYSNLKAGGGAFGFDVEKHIKESGQHLRTPTDNSVGESHSSSEDDRLQHPDGPLSSAEGPLSSETAPNRSRPTPPLSEAQSQHTLGDGSEESRPKSRKPPKGLGSGMGGGTA